MAGQSRGAESTAMEQQVDFRIREVSVSDAEGIDLTTRLHMDLLGFGPMARFGDRFIRETVYVVGLSDELLKVAIAEVDGHPAGFIAYTSEAHSFHNALIGNHFFKAVSTTLMALLSRPGRVLNLPRAFQVVRSRNELSANLDDDVDCEVVCFGVYPDFLTPAFVRRTKLRIGVQLLEHVFGMLSLQGHKKVRMIVDGDNPRAMLFYQSMGAEITPTVFGGIQSYIVRFNLQDRS
jgi:ribosomal protein S18 acetylase RimI-like enzyme